MTVDRAALDELTGLGLRPAVSILMSTHRAGREIGQDWIRLKNLLRDVERQLEARGLAREAIARLVAPAHKLVDDRAFWRHQENGLAVYAAANFFRTYRCPQPFRELALVSERFQVAQLFPLLSGNRHFYVLALSQNDVRLIEATRTAGAEVDLGNLPRSLPEALLTEPPGQELQQHVVSAVGAKRAAMFHGHGPGLDDRKEEIRQFFHRLDRGLRPFLSDRDAPLVLAAVDYLLPLYREANTHPGLLREGIVGSPEGHSAAMLGSRGWDIVRAHMETVEAAAVARYQDLAGSARVSTDLVAIVRASHEGRVADLFVAPDAERWGSFEPDSGVVNLQERPGVVGEDLLNLAAIHTFQRGGTVHVVARERVPGGKGIAAVFRY
jgi:Bacterial archaeo-eukaryotic release factor family 7